MPYEHILYDVHDGVAKITLNRQAALNAFVDPMRYELADAIHAVATDVEAKTLVITGAGRAFSAGGDVSAMMVTPEQHQERLRITHQWLRELVYMPKVSIAAVNGPAVGGGCNLALACDLVIASRQAKFGQPFIRRALVPDVAGMYILPRSVGIARSKELSLLGDPIDAEEAERIGLINRVVEPEELEPVTMALARQLAEGPTMAIGVAKTLLNRAVDSDFERVLEYELWGQRLCNASEDHQEGARAFMEKRPPRFIGR